MSKLNYPAIQQELSKALTGRPEAIELAMVALLAHGHVLIEDVPGVGKTTLAIGIAKIFGLSFSRVQMTSDLLPTDLIGTNMYHPEKHEFQFKKGPLFENVVLADELNRTPPKTQSALLEAMEEGSISVDGITHALPKHFFVVATQNPMEQAGTFELPESQMDRFLARIEIGYPPIEVEAELVETLGRSRTTASVRQLHSLDDLDKLRMEVDQVTIHADLAKYITSIASATRNHPEIRLGVSPRGSIAMAQAAKARALIQGRNYVVPDDVKHLVIPVWAHRLTLLQATSGYELAANILEKILIETPVPA